MSQRSLAGETIFYSAKGIPFFDLIQTKEWKRLDRPYFYCISIPTCKNPSKTQEGRFKVGISKGTSYQERLWDYQRHFGWFFRVHMLKLYVAWTHESQGTGLHKRYEAKLLTHLKNKGFVPIAGAEWFPYQDKDAILNEILKLDRSPELLKSIQALPKKKSERLLVMQEGQPVTQLFKEDKIEKVTAHTTKEIDGVIRTLYTVKWNNPTIMPNGKKNYLTKETYQNMMKMIDGRKKVREYQMKHPKTQFYD